MKPQFAIFLMLVFPTILLAQQFPSPASNQINNQMMLEQQWAIQQRDNTSTLQRSLIVLGQKLENEENKQNQLEYDISALNHELSETKEIIENFSNSNSDLENKLEKINKSIDKKTKRLEDSNQTIEEIKSKMRGIVDKLKIEVTN